jgi:hypothetical protein
MRRVAVLMAFVGSAALVVRLLVIRGRASSEASAIDKNAKLERMYAEASARDARGLDYLLEVHPITSWA